MRPAWLLPTRETIAPLPVASVRAHVDRERITNKFVRWWHGPKGALWKMKTREQRNAYHRERYKGDAKRRAYLTAKQREYRAAKKKRAS